MVFEQELWNVYNQETKEHIDNIEENLLFLENDFENEEIIGEIFRNAHSIKGSSATMELTELAELTHSMENLFEMLRSKKLTVNSEIINISLEALDVLKELFEATLSKSDYTEIDYKTMINNIDSFLEHGRASNEIINKHTKKETNNNLYDKNSLRIEIELNKNALMKSVILFQIIYTLKDFGKVLSTEPKFDDNIPDESFGDKIIISFNTNEKESNIIKNIQRFSGVNKCNVSKFKTEQKKSIKSKKTSKADNSTIRINVSKIDSLINKLGELILDKESLKQLVLEYRKKMKNDPLTNRFEDVMEHVNHIVADIQETILSTRMLTLENVFSKFPRVVRDLSQKLEKNIDFVIEGKDTEVDREIIEEIIDPLNHIIRNAIDHGIELPEKRKKNGKNPVASLKLSAVHKEGSVFITIADDGGGININAVKEKAIKSGIKTSEELDKLSNDEINALIFEPGFSTAKNISDISGRGVGLDIVKTKIKKVHGNISITSTEGIGTTFSIKLPVTMAITNALIFQEEDYKFALPLLSITEVLKLENKEFSEKTKTINKCKIFKWRENIIHVKETTEFFKIDKKQNTDKVFLLIVFCNNKFTAIKTHKIIKRQELVVKSLSQFTGEQNLLGNMDGITGVSILGDGSLVYVMDPFKIAC